jgi:ElaA protein
MQSTTIVCKHFKELSTTELYNIIKLRIQVFCVEQNCPYQDADGKDFESWHLMIHDADNTLIAYSRILPKGISYPEYVSIGRIVTAELVRMHGFGKLLMLESLKQTTTLFGNAPIKISAQAYLRKFYTSFGFVATGEEYIEDHIPHIGMVKLPHQAPHKGD